MRAPRKALFVALLLLVTVLQLPLAIIPHAQCAEGDYIDSWDVSVQVTTPYGIATDGSNIYVADLTGKEIYKYTMAGGYTTDHFDTSAHGTDLYGVATDGTNIWTLSHTDKEVYKWNMAGGYIDSWDTSAHGSNPRDLTTDGSNIYVIDQVSDEVYKYTMAGVYVSSWDTSANGNDPYGVATDGTYIWTIDGATDDVDKYTMDGYYFGTWPTSGQVTTARDITTNGTVFWVVDQTDKEVYIYEGPPSGSGLWQISQGSDDCIKYDATWSTASPLGPYWHSASASTVASGLRWQNITIPSGASIESAYIRWCAWSTVGGVAAAPIVIIRGEDIDSSLTFSTVGDFDARDRTDASAGYSIPALIAAAWYDTSDLSTIIQEIIDRGGWSSGNNLTLFTGPKSLTTSSKYGRSYDLASGEWSPFLIITWTPPQVSGSVEWQVGQQSDDCYYENDPTPSFKTDNTEVACGDYSLDYYDFESGMRFTGINIPPESTIDSAFLILEADGLSGVIPTTYIKGQDADDTITFSTVGDYTGRARTAETVTWIPGAWVTGVDYTSTDIKSIIQAIVDREGWTSGNSIVIFWYEADGYIQQERILADAYRGSAADAPRLNITWSAPPTDAITNKGIIATDSTVDDEQWFFLNASIEILPNTNTFLFNRIDIDPDGLNMSCSYTNSTDTFVEENDPNNYLQLDVVVSVKTDLNNTFVRVDYYLRIHSNVTKDGVYNVTVYSTASGDLSDSDNYTSVFTLTIRTPSAPTLLFGAGFNASAPHVELHWTHNLLIFTIFEVQNSSNDADWGHLGQNTTAQYTDSQVVNGTQRYYKVRACRITGVGWKNSSFTDSNFETVYFVEAAAGAPANGDTIIMGAAGVFWIILIIIVPIVAYVLKKG